MQIRDQVLKLLLVDRVAQTRHHIAAADDALLNKLVVGDQAARQVFLLIQPFQGRPLSAAGTVSAVAHGTVKLIDAPAMGLLWVQTQFSISLLLQVFAAAGQQQH